MANPYFEHSNVLVPQTLGRAEQVNQMARAIEGGFDKLPAPEDISGGRANYYVAGGTANALTVTMAPAITAYTEGLALAVKITADNTAAATINVNGVGVKSLKRYNGDALLAGDLKTGMIALFSYDGTNFRMTGIHGGEVELAMQWATSTAVVSGGLKGSRGYAQEAGSSATAAANSATAAATSEGNAASSASAASTSETNAAASETAAGTSETNAAASETAAAGSASAASSSASAASTSETNAAASETAAGISEGNAATSETNAAGSASAAASSASAASTSETNAAGSASAAATSASNASTSESNAAGSATLSMSWANEAEDVEVTTGEYSAYHWAQKALAAASYYTQAQIDAFFSGGTAITGYNKSNWDTAFGWGNHASAGYEPAFTKNNAFNKNFGTAAGTVAQGNDSRINNGQTAYGWGNHASAGYEPGFSKNNAFNKNFGSALGTVAQGNDSRINNGQTAFGWGNHAGLYLPIGGGTLTGNLTIPNAIFHSGDTDTYIQFHAANQWRVVAGGGERLEVNTTGINVTGAIVASGDVTAFSDERLKSDIETIPDALNKVSRMRGVTFLKDERRGSGLIAQELQEVAPELVHTNGEYLAVAYGNLSGYLIEAVKELRSEIVDQRETISDLMDAVRDLRHEVEALKNDASR